MNHRGVSLASFIKNEELGILNLRDITHFHSQIDNFTVIHNSLSSLNALLDFKCQILPDLFGSDHSPILLESAGSERMSRRWRLDKADWQLFTELTLSDRSLGNFDSSDEAATYFSGIM